MPLQKLVTQPLVFLGGVLSPALKVLSVERSVGGKRLDRALLEWDLAGTGGDRLHNTSLISAFNGAQCAVVAVNFGVQRVIHWGKLHVTRFSIGDVLNYHLESRLEPQHFGEPIVSRMVRSRQSGGVYHTTVRKPIIFNPLIDGVVVPNRSAKWKIPQSDAWGFLDEEIRTEPALKWQEEITAASQIANLPAWTLEEAVLYLCTAGNPNQTYIKNPDRAQLAATLDPSPHLLKHHEIPDGLFLPAALDKLLEPFGYGWYVEQRTIQERQIRVFRRGEGRRRTVSLQAAGSGADLALSSLQRCDLALDASSKLVNVLESAGANYQLEVTVELVPAWPETLDALDRVEDLALSSDNFQNAANAHYQRVWRDWVLNEAGDYIGERTSITEPFNLTDLKHGIDYLHRRRQLLPCLTLAEDGAPIGNLRGVEVEWHDGTDWRPLEDLSLEGRSCHVLERECGIRFDGELPPAEIQSLGLVGSTPARVRVTACIELDRALRGFEQQPASLAGEPVPLYLDVPEKFLIRKLLDKGPHASKYLADVQAGTRIAAEVDDQQAIDTFTQKLLTAWNQGDLAGRLVLVGLEWNYELGETVSTITGRNLDLKVDTAGQRYPTIVGLEYDVPEMTFTITLESFAPVPPELAET